MNLADNAKLLGLEAHLNAHIRGQTHVLPRIVSLLQRGQLGLTKSNRPRGSFLFLGPTGVGKTETVITFTDFLFGEGKLFRFDMSEYQTQESLGVLLGAKLGERGTLAMAFDRSRSGTLLFDEIEKAHPRILDIFLQILDAARVTMANGETLDLSGFYVVFTTNIGGADLLNVQHSTFATMERHVLARAQQTMRPELFARITEKLVFSRLTYDYQLEIAQLLLNNELQFLRDKGCDVSERLKAASGERIKSGHFEAERLIAEAGSDGEQLRDESTQNEPATVNHHVMAARVVLSADRAGAATAPGNGFKICPAA